MDPTVDIEINMETITYTRGTNIQLKININIETST